MESQNERIEDHLKRGGSITPLQALRLYGCFRLSGRIHDLRSQGLDIKTDIVKTSTGKRIASYHL